MLLQNRPVSYLTQQHSLRQQPLRSLFSWEKGVCEARSTLDALLPTDTPRAWQSTISRCRQSTSLSRQDRIPCPRWAEMMTHFVARNPVPSGRRGWPENPGGCGSSVLLCTIPDPRGLLPFFVPAIECRLCPFWPLLAEGLTEAFNK